nr:MAG TPA: hypothetical protein [Caudoviricetes sp.]
MAWMLLGVGLAIFIAGLTTALIVKEIDEWIDTRCALSVGNLFNIIVLALVGYPGAWLTFTHITGVGL